MFCSVSSTTACATHRVSKAAWEGSLKNSAKNGYISCPIAGCRGKWSVKDVAVDEEFFRELKRYLRRKDIRANLLDGSGPSSSSSGVDAFEIE